MCFSATASFGASVVLGAIGMVTVAKSTTNSQRIFATIPLIFAVQQLSEGFLWLSLKNAEMAGWQSIFTYIFLIFAMAVWPFWIPWSVRLLEKNPKRKKAMNILVATGAVVAVGVCCILFLYPVQAVTPLCLTCPTSSTPPIINHIHYEFAIPSLVKKLIAAFSVLYIAATIVTPFISSVKKMKGLGIVFFISYLFAITFYNGFVISVWCFFAAVLSFVVLWIVIDLNDAYNVNTD